MTTSTSPPDISSLTLSPQRSQQSANESYDTYDGRSPYHYSTSPPVIPGQGQFAQVQNNQTPLKPRRAGLPEQWLGNSAADPRSLSPQQSSDISSGGSPPPQSQLTLQSLGSAPNQLGALDSDEVIPTAIVIKNIPFNVKRETLLEIIISLNIPTPYAFNYHLDPSGAFRGLAFANFRQPQDADAVVAALNGFDVQGRKLRVEYKKVLQAGEKERIEREKALRRMRSMQMEKEALAVQHGQQSYDEFGPVVTPVTPSRQYSVGLGNPYQQPYSPPAVPPLPVQQPFLPASSPPLALHSMPPVTPSKSTTELDLNDPATLDIYSRILLFKDDHMRDELAFSRMLTPKQRRIVHLVAQKLGVYHYSLGDGEERYAVVTRNPPNESRPPPQRALSQTFSKATASYLQGAIPPMDSATGSLRSKKSMPDMKTLHTSQPRLNTRSSNGNIREGYKTIASPSRRSPGGFGALFNSGGGFGSLSGGMGGNVPPVPSIPEGLNGGGGGGGGGGGANDGPNSGVVRQPRGPSSGTSGFALRKERVSASESAAQSLEARTHEPLEF